MVSARAPIRFCIWRRGFAFDIDMLFAFYLGDLKNLPVDHIGAAQNAKEGHYRDEDSAGSHPAIQIETDEKTETNAAGHGEADL